MAALGSAVATLQQAAQEQPLGSCYDMAVETLALACYAATQLARQVEALRLRFLSSNTPRLPAGHWRRHMWHAPACIMAQQRTHCGQLGSDVIRHVWHTMQVLCLINSCLFYRWQLCTGSCARRPARACTRMSLR